MRRTAGGLVLVLVLAIAASSCGSEAPSTVGEPSPQTSEAQQSPDPETVSEKAERRAQDARERRAEAREARERKAEEAARLHESVVAERRREAKERKEAVAQRKREERTGGWTGVHGDNYEIAEIVCGSKSMEGVARDLGLSSSADEFEIAEAYADGFQGAFQQPNFEGCLKGLGIG